MSSGPFSDQPITRGLIAGFRFAALKEELTDARHRRKIREENQLIAQRQAAQRQELNAAALKAARRRALGERFDIAERVAEASAVVGGDKGKKSTEPQKQGPPLPDAEVEPGGIDPVAIAGLIREELGAGKSSAGFGMTTIIADAAIRNKEDALREELRVEENVKQSDAMEAISSALQLISAGADQVYLDNFGKQTPTGQAIVALNSQEGERPETFQERTLRVREAELEVRKNAPSTKELGVIQTRLAKRESTPTQDAKDRIREIELLNTVGRGRSLTDTDFLQEVRNLPDVVRARKKVDDLRGKVSEGLKRIERKVLPKITERTQPGHIEALQKQVKTAHTELLRIQGKALADLGAPEGLVKENREALSRVKGQEKLVKKATVKINGIDVVPTNDPDLAVDRAKKALPNGTDEEQAELARKIFEAARK